MIFILKDKIEFFFESIFKHLLAKISHFQEFIRFFFKKLVTT